MFESWINRLVSPPRSSRRVGLKLNEMSVSETSAAMYSPVTVGQIRLANRFAMAPMTRSRAQYDGTPSEMAPEYYAQRASVGLIIAEGTQPSDDGQGYTLTPGIYTDAHVAGWSKITDAVHRAGSSIFIQLMHVGRTSHPDNTPHHRQGLAPSAITPKGEIFTPTGMQPIPEPREMTLEDIQRTIGEFRHAARRAVEAGADGVELHAANGYLLHQFLAPNANVRTDQYGGSPDNRARFVIEVAKAVAEEIGGHRTGIRLSPSAPVGDLEEGPGGPNLYRYLTYELNKLGLAYLHLLHIGEEGFLAEIRGLWNTVLIVNRPGRPLTAVGADVAASMADVEAYGQFVLSNPDFTKRVKANAPLNDGQPASYFGGGAEGYIDYPTLVEP